MVRIPCALLVTLTGCYLSHAPESGSDASVDTSAFDVSAFDVSAFDVSAFDVAVVDANVPDVVAPIDASTPSECSLTITTGTTVLYGDRRALSPRLVRLPNSEIGLVTHDPDTGSVSYRRFTDSLEILSASRTLEARSPTPASVTFFDGLMRVGVATPVALGQVRSFGPDGDIQHVGVRFPAFAPLRLFAASESLLWVGIRGGTFGSLRVVLVGRDSAPIDETFHDIEATIEADDLIALVRPDGRSFVLVYSLLTAVSAVSAYASILEADGRLSSPIALTPESDSAVFPVDLGGRLFFARSTHTGLFVDAMDYDTLEVLGRTEFPARPRPLQIGTFDGRFIAVGIEGNTLIVDDYGRSLTESQRVTGALIEPVIVAPELLELPDALIVAVGGRNGGRDSATLFRVECAR